MSDIRKWMKIMESVPSVIIKKDATVMVDPSIGGGTARYMHSTPQGAMVDIKGVPKELSHDQFSLPERDYQDPYQSGNSWNHVTNIPDSVGRMNDKPEFRSGDMVIVDNVFGTVIGPGVGIFIAYGTTGKDCVIDFDGKKIIVPISNVGAMLEQEAKDNFGEMDNDGNLSPMSFGSDNVNVEQPQTSMSVQEPEMDQRDEFSKWMQAVEEALKTESTTPLEEHPAMMNECGCDNWDCPTCFPDQGMGMQPGMGMHEPHDHNDSELVPLDSDEEEFEFEFEDGSAGGTGAAGVANVPMEEEDNEFIEKSKSGKGVKLGDIVRKTEFRKAGGQNSPMTYGDDNLDEELPPGANPNDFGKAGKYLQNHFGEDDIEENDNDEFDQDSSDAHDMISAIKYMQQMGLSNADRDYSEEELASMSLPELKKVHDMTTGEVAESKPAATKSKHHLDDLDDILSPAQDNPVVGMDEPDDEGPESGEMSLPRSSAANTRSKTAGITPSDTMRDYMNRINMDVAGGDEPELPMNTGNELAVTTANVPMVIDNAIQSAGIQNPEWHTIDNLPGYMQRAIRGMGRQLFSMFTSTPLENIQTIANVNGQGPNTDAEMRAVAGWLKNSAEDLGKVDVSHGMAIPGYEPDVREYRANGVRFQVVRDPMGQYIYAYPDKDARTPAGQGEQGQLAGGRGNMPRLRESTINFDLKATLFEKMKWDDELDEAFIQESSLSKLIGKQKGGQMLVRWLHRRHRLSNDADLQPAPFSERLLWKEFKNHPDNFVIVTAQNGVAGIKPDKKFIDQRTKEFAKKGKTYNPGGDSTLPYQVVAFTDDGEQVDPELLRAPPEDGEDYRDPRDPTVMRARMGKHSGKDMQNPYNVFNLLADQIGTLRQVYISGFENEKGGEQKGSVERGKIAKRVDLKKGTNNLTSEEAVQKIFLRIKPVLKTLANQAILQINKRAQRYIEGGNFEGAQKVAATGQKLKQLLVSLDTNNAVNVDTSYTSNTGELSSAITKAIAQASSSTVGSEEYDDFATKAAAGSMMELRPVLDAVRDQLVGL